MFFPQILIVALALADLAFAALYVTAPSRGSTCRGGEPCTVSWLDDGTSPLISSFGVSQVGLYTGEMQLVQAIEPVDVAGSISLTFTPNPEAGPNSDTYYICFTSTSLQVNGSAVLAFSPFFSLDGMNGSFDNPLPVATESIPIPSSLSSSSSGTQPLSTETVGTLSTSISSITSLAPTTTPTPSSTSTSSGFVTSIASTSPTSTSSSTAAEPTESAEDTGDIVPATDGSGPGLRSGFPTLFLVFLLPFILSFSL